LCVYILGARGNDGIAGSTGATGVGRTGATGASGVPGNNGATGATGVAGFTGATGPQGINGNHGFTGPVGPAGPPGIGQIGPPGPPGCKFKMKCKNYLHLYNKNFHVKHIVLNVIKIAACSKNECKTNNGNCNQLCVDTYDSYYCACNTGYQIVNTPFTCPGQSNF
jgi:hypothetical protein